VQSVGYPNGQGLSYAYDTRGNRIGLTATVGASTLTTSYTYDALNRLQMVTDPTGRVYTSTYDPNGNRTALAYPNGVTTSATYDVVNRLTGLTTTHSASGQTIQSYAYTVGPAGQRTRITEHGGTVKDYSYDALSRLTNERINTGGTLTSEEGFTYDPVGNRTTRTGVGGNTAVAYTYYERDRLLSANTSTSTWDAQGNLQSTTGEATYTWDVENRLIRVATIGGPVVTHVYDADGNRVQTTVTSQTGTPVVTNYLVDTSEELSHVVAAYFTPKLPLISLESCHPFQGKSATDFTRILPPP
jgi:YD repeat-containing protein